MVCAHAIARERGRSPWIREADNIQGRFSVDRTMLVLSRKTGEKILIGDDISITVVRVAQGMVRIGVEAPNETPIVREEIKDRDKTPVAGSTTSGEP